MSTEYKLLRVPQVLEITGLSRTGLYERVRAGVFPRGFKLGTSGSKGAVAWRSTEVQAWMDNLLRAEAGVERD
jgi:prophage regulatory protein